MKNHEIKAEDGRVIEEVKIPDTVDTAVEWNREILGKMVTRYLRDHRWEFYPGEGLDEWAYHPNFGEFLLAVFR